VHRVEDRRILTGQGRYIDDLQLPRMLHAAFVRSPMAHAAVASVEAAAARALPGVFAVLTGADIADLVQPMPVRLAGMAAPVFYPLATDRVRHVGDPVAVVIAESRYLAEDGAELVDVDYEPLPPVATYEAALDPASLPLFGDLAGNVLSFDPRSFGDVDAAFAAADRVISRTFSQERLGPVPMETRGAVADYHEANGELTFHCNAQNAHALRLGLAQVLGLDLDRVRVLVSEDVGGAFGLKSTWGREVFAVAAAARLLRRPVKWTEDRNEHLLTSGHAREERIALEAAVKDDGTLLGLRAALILDQGAYPSLPTPAVVNTGTISSLLPGPYRWRAYSFSRTHVITNKCTYVAYRGPWHIETWSRERMLDEIARELGLDPAELRRRNYHAGGQDDQLITGPGLSGITTRASLDLVLDLIGADGFRREQETAWAQGRCLGLGFASYLESAPGPANHRENLIPFVSEPAVVRLEGDGRLLVETAQVPQGQGHQTTLAQVAADTLGVPFDHVKVVHGDTRTAPFKFIGTGGSLSATWASGSVVKATRKVKEKVLAIAAAQLEISAADLEITDGVIAPRGDPSAGIPLAKIAMQALMMPQTLPPGTDPVLRAEERFTGDGITGSGWSGGTHACTVEIDLETGQVKILRYAVAEDCGTVINPAVVEGQIRGGVAQGIGEVLYERAAYDRDANFLSSTFMDYLLPTAAEIPPIEIAHVETGIEGEFGWRGVGEGGAIVSPATLTNAIADALAPFGARVTDVYLPPAKILELAGLLHEPGAEPESNRATVLDRGRLTFIP
jgi:carbon-monoxide dehydrogenase large subunit